MLGEVDPRPLVCWQHTWVDLSISLYLEATSLNIESCSWVVITAASYSGVPVQILDWRSALLADICTESESL
jgi:hypothetical protein